MAPIRCAILGMGMSTTVFHAPFVLANPTDFILKTIFERRATADYSEARKRYPNVNVVNSFNAVLEDKEIELVFVCTINDTHFQYTKECLEAGKHVVIEKPITPTSAEARELAALAKAKGLVLAVYQNRRYDSDFLTVQKLVKAGTFGELAEFESRYDRYKNIPAVKLWKESTAPGTGAAYDLGSHLVDQLLTLFGKPERVTAILSNSRLIGSENVPDAFIIHLHYPATSATGRTLPLIATARGSILSLVSPQLRFTVKGTKAAFLKSGLDVQESQLIAKGAAALNESDFATEDESIYGKLYELGRESSPTTIVSEKGNYLSWFKNVAYAVRNGREHLEVTPEQAVLTIEVIEAATISSREGRSVKL